MFGTQTETENAQRWTDETGYKRHPRKLKLCIAAIQKAAHLKNDFLQITGDHGGTPHIFRLSVIFDTETKSPNAAKEYAAIGARYAWEFDRNTLPKIAAECLELCKRAADPESGVLTVEDKRRTPDEITAQAERMKAADEKQANRNAERMEADRAAEAADPEAFAIGKARGADQSKLLRAAFKARGWNQKVISVKYRSYSMGSSIDVTIKDAAIVTDYAEVKRLLEAAENISRCEYSGEILSGGNSYTRLEFSSEANAQTAAPFMEAAAVAVAELEGQAETARGVNIAGTDYAVYKGNGTPDISIHGPAGARMQLYGGDDRTAHYVAQRLGSHLFIEGAHPLQQAPAAPAQVEAVTDTAAPSVVIVADTFKERAAAAGFAVELHTHTQKRREMALVTMETRTDRAEYFRRLAQCKDLGGHYSRPWKGTPGGFAFWVDDNGKATAWALIAWIMGDSDGAGPDSGPGGSDAPTATETATAPPKGKAPAPVRHAVNTSKLESMAERMERDAADKLGPRMENTPKQQAQAASARIDGNRLARGAAYLRAWIAAAGLDALPAILHKGPTKAEALKAAAKPYTDPIANGFHTYHMESTDPDAWHDMGARAVALRGLVDTSATDETNAAAAEKARQLAGLRGINIPGFFPTPPAVVAAMIEAAGNLDGQWVLEPSAGIGSIVEAVEAAGGKVAAVESIPRLASFVEEWTGARVHAGDFLEKSPDNSQAYGAVLMNPPFEQDAGLRHVRHAFRFLEVDGVLCAVLPAAAKQYAGAISKERRAFAAWVESVGGEWVELPARAFADRVEAFRPCGIECVLLIIRNE